MTTPEVAAALERGAVVLDLRPPLRFAAGHPAGAINLQFNRADLAERADMVLPHDVEYIVYATPDPIAVVAVAILREAGFKVAGPLTGALDGWELEGRIELLQVIDVDELEADLDRYQVIDAREGYEYRHGHIAGAILLPAREAWNRAAELRSDRPLAVICGSQVRSSLVASILLRVGREPVLVMGGMTTWLERRYPVETLLSEVRT